MKLRERLDGPRGTMIAIMAATLIAAGVLLSAIYSYAWALESRTLRRSAEAHAAQLALSLESYARLLQEHTAELASSTSVVQALAAGGTAPPRAFPGLHSAQLLALGALGIADPAFIPGAMYNNIEVNLVGAAFNASPTRAEANSANGQWVLSAAAAVAAPDGNGRAGVLLLRADLQTVLRDFLTPASASGDYSLWLVAADGKLAALEQEHAAPPDESATYRVATAVAGVQAGFRPSQAFIADASITGLPLMLGTVCGACILIGLVGFAFRQLRMQLREDALRLEDLALYQRSATAAIPSLHYPVLAPLGEALVQLRRANRAHAGQDFAEPAVERSSIDALEILELEETDPDTVRFESDATLEIPPEIFRDYDIRGRASQISKALAHAIGQAIASEALDRGMTSMVVATDARESSPLLREHLVQGMLACGIDVIDAGTVPTPMLYFACHHLHTMSGVMVTGSHNPADHNGFKIMIDGETLCGERIADLRQRISGQRYHQGQGSYRVTEIDSDYSKAILDDVLVESPLKLVIDCGNGAASVIAVELFQELGCEVLPLFCELDGRFPNHPPDPSVAENLEQLIAEVRARGADLGIAFDGDGDRLGVVTASGNIVMADRLLMLFARDLLSRNPGADIVFDVKCSRNLTAVIVQNGGRPIMCRSGHSWIKEKMKETGALLGGEFTGHICFRDRWFGFDDALYSAARLLEILTASGQSLDELNAELPHAIGTPELRIEVPEEHKFALQQRIVDSLALENARLIKLDGVRAEYPDGWGLVRASNTSAALICRFEADDEEAMRRIQAAFRAELGSLLPDIALPF
ncbi:MAG: phosphomannomutase/phosphoglucomutase [Gammaproteobacteria bacterium]|nr:phosphomannomutase/phosphoglucomutase [Gammaproteobacteria bacterium]MBK6582839.1 phosphomannomutase/phosphoglucomutase [Gammaproteobacteria bacterium]MBK7518968.1 phosphomannomutase/phosphoglucomutase [Gammaproteobacteria bacterium]MBK7730290.1 phosphomannomutase/phosphoglucomutase [Gammaproteobacteria bacterium]MBK8306104.1 phosphomannomutase/phosphoglucomutase [Gammaproteobacteria bacterium]